jgi:hypothetical protein
MNTLEHFRFVDDCHILRSMGFQVGAIAKRLGYTADEVRLALESSPVGSSPQG